MQKEKVRLKSNNQGLQLLIEEGLSFEESFRLLKQKMVQSAGYFSDVDDVVLTRQSVNWQKEDFIKLGEMLAGYKLKLKILEMVDFKEILEKNISTDSKFEYVDPKGVVEKTNNKNNLKDIERAVIVHKTLRSGTKVMDEHSVVIIGDVNPGAEIVAGGSIFIFGNMFGFAHAGAYGNRDAIIMASKLKPIQLRIDDLIANYTPDKSNVTEKNIQGEIAFIKENAVMIKIVEKKHI